MSIKALIDQARADYETAVAEFITARDRVSAAKRTLKTIEGKVRSSQQVASSRLSQRRAQVLRKHPELRKIHNQARRREAIDAILAARDRPRVWKFYLDDMQHDSVTNTRKPYRINRERYKLYTAALKLQAQLARARGELDTARSLELHLQSLVDVSPREVTVHWPGEWRAISAALRPEGSSPKGDAARRLLSVYQHIIKTHTEEDTP